MSPGDIPLGEIVASEHYALERGWRGDSYQQAIKHDNFNPQHWPKARVTERGVRLTYKEYFGVEEEDHSPDKRLHEPTKHMLWAGSNY